MFFRYVTVIFFLLFVGSFAAYPSKASGRRLHLQRDRLSLGYRRRLQIAFDKLSTWSEANDVSLRSALKTAADANRLLINYCQSCYDDGSAYWLALYAVLAVQTMIRPLKGALRGAWDSLQTWRLSMPVLSRVPLRLEVVEALSHYSIMAALSLDTGRGPQWLLLAALIRTFFFGLLRPKEFFGLEIADVRVPCAGAFRRLRSAVVVVRDPKNRAHGGRLQARLLRDDRCVLWLTWALQSLPASGRMWPFPRELFVKLFKQGLVYLELDRVGFSLGSFRAGGATALLEDGMPISQIKYCGGWSADKTLSSYLQEAESALTLINLSPAAAARLERLLVQLAHLDAPPPISATQLLSQWTRPRRWPC